MGNQPLEKSIMFDSRGGHALLLLGNCQSSLLLQREGVLPNDVGSAFEDLTSDVGDVSNQTFA